MFNLFKKPKINVGDIWEYTPSSNADPFREKTFRTFEVLDVKKGYVQYVDLDTLNVYSEPIGVFIINSKFVKNKKDANTK